MRRFLRSCRSLWLLGGVLLAGEAQAEATLSGASVTNLNGSDEITDGTTVPGYSYRTLAEVLSPEGTVKARFQHHLALTFFHKFVGGDFRAGSASWQLSFQVVAEPEEPWKLNIEEQRVGKVEVCNGGRGSGSARLGPVVYVGPALESGSLDIRARYSAQTGNPSAGAADRQNILDAAEGVLLGEGPQTVTLKFLTPAEGGSAIDGGSYVDSNCDSTFCEGSDRAGDDSVVQLGLGGGRVGNLMSTCHEMDIDNPGHHVTVNIAPRWATEVFPYAPDANDILIVDPAFGLLRFDPDAALPRQLEYLKRKTPAGPMVSPRAGFRSFGDLLVVDPGARSVFKLDLSTGNLIEIPTGVKLLCTPVSIARLGSDFLVLDRTANPSNPGVCDGTGHVFVVNGTTGIQTPVAWDPSSDNDAFLSQPSDLAVTDDGSLAYVADEEKGILRLENMGGGVWRRSFVRRLAAIGSVSGLALDASGVVQNDGIPRLYVTSASSQEVRWVESPHDPFTTSDCSGSELNCNRISSGGSLVKPRGITIVPRTVSVPGSTSTADLLVSDVGAPGGADGRLLRLQWLVGKDWVNNGVPTVRVLGLSDPYGVAASHACSNGLDDDGDGKVDFPADTGCTGPTDLSEHEADHPCDDGIDNDGDGLVDFPADPDCASPLDATEGTDSDGDLVPDSLDNCTYEPNAAQTDSGGINTAVPDGIGDACQCGDTNNDGKVTSTDVTVLKRALAGLSPAFSVPGLGVGLGKCNVAATATPGAAGCTATDATVISRALAGLTPGIFQGCDAAAP